MVIMFLFIGYYFNKISYSDNFVMNADKFVYIENKPLVKVSLKNQALSAFRLNNFDRSYSQRQSVILIVLSSFDF